MIQLPSGSNRQKLDYLERAINIIRWNEVIEPTLQNTNPIASLADYVSYYTGFDYFTTDAQITCSPSIATSNILFNFILSGNQIEHVLAESSTTPARLYFVNVGDELYDVHLTDDNGVNYVIKSVLMKNGYDSYIYYHVDRGLQVGTESARLDVDGDNDWYDFGYWSEIRLQHSPDIVGVFTFDKFNYNSEVAMTAINLKKTGYTLYPSALIYPDTLSVETSTTTFSINADVGEFTFIEQGS